MPKFLFKANDKVLSHCACIGEPAMSTGQLDCPWCGCGWLISCSKCAKGFTFATIAETDIPLAQLGQREAKRRGLNVTKQDIEDWASGMAQSLEPFDVGETVVYLDGEYWALDSRDIKFDGFFARHELPILPHAEALERPEVLRGLLGNQSYWLDRALPERD